MPSKPRTKKMIGPLRDNEKVYILENKDKPIRALAIHLNRTQTIIQKYLDKVYPPVVEEKTQPNSPPTEHQHNATIMTPKASEIPIKIKGDKDSKYYYGG